MMRWLRFHHRTVCLLIVGGMAMASLALAPSRSGAAGYGRLSGTVTDSEGNPLIGASILISGPLLPNSGQLSTTVERVITDARGRFSVEHLVPGWYSLQATSVTRMPALRNRIHVESGGTSRQDFILSDIFAPLQLQVPQGSVTTWGEDWKWVLRASSTTRPILRYQPAAKSRKAPVDKNGKTVLPASQRLIGMVPGSARRRPLSDDPGMGSVLAYLRPLSVDSDVLVAGSMASSGMLSSSLATAFRRNMLKGDPLQVAIVVHQLSYTEGLPLASGIAPSGLVNAQAIMLDYSNSHRLSGRWIMTSGMEVDYLNAAHDARAARPRVAFEYQATSATSVSVRYGAGHLDSNSTLLERVGELNTFPRLTERGYRPQLEDLQHAEAAVTHKFGKNSKIEAAAFHDDSINTAVWGFGPPGALGWMAGNALPNPAVDGWTLNAGSYRSNGYRVAYSRRFGDSIEAALVYAEGNALAIDPVAAARAAEARDLRGLLRADRCHSWGGRITGRVPVTKTQLTTSYTWLPKGSVTGVDPYGMADLDLRPYLDFEIRQPLPSIASIPAHIEALADFRNMLAQGYVPLAGSGEEPLILTSSYRSFRGGFSVQF